MEIFSQSFEVKFLGDNFDHIVSSLSDSNADKIYCWLEGVICGSVRHLVKASDARYKEYSIKQLVVFRYAFVMSGIDYRILLVKVKNSFYIEFHLGNHKYYDNVRKNLGLKKNSY